MKNIGIIDRMIRIVAGLGTLSLVYFIPGNERYWGLIGIVPLLTGLFGLCPIYQLLGLNTCRKY